MAVLAPGALCYGTDARMLFRMSADDNTSRFYIKGNNHDSYYRPFEVSCVTSERQCACNPG
ncbi:hypothetical protein E2C01_081520 [Portunus trituberculatus]|uniref:Uncharacterized protein n=1 Tax=Portunus trituberculatus TaxID=210409 RepID=A0A5B7J2J2_PORTR|nr:hypothetical protein [Portunus trituberculatus]